MGQEAAQHAELRLVQPGAGDEAPEACHCLARGAVLQEADAPQGGAQVLVEAIERRRGGEAPVRRELGRRATGGLEQLVAHHLHGHRQVEGWIGRVRGNHEVRGAALKLRIGEAARLAPKQDRRGFGGGLGGELPGRRLGVGAGPRDASGAGAGAKHPRAIGDRVIQRVHHGGVRHHIERLRGPPVRLRVRKPRRTHEVERREPHRLHGARRGANVAGVAGFDEHDADMVHGWRGLGET